MLLVLDNYDSFTFNIVQYLGELATNNPLAADIRVERNDALDVDQIRKLKVSRGLRLQTEGIHIRIKHIQS